MGYEESKKHLLSLSYPELQCLCTRYNLPTKRSRSQLASSLASLLEASSSPAAPPVQLENTKQAPTCNLVNNKRGPYSGRDDGIPLVHAKHQKGDRTPVNETSKKKEIGTGTNIIPVSINHGKLDCHVHPSSDLGTAHNLQSRSDVGIATKTANLEFVGKHHCSPANIIDQICPPIVQRYPSNGNVQASTPFGHMNDNTDKGCRLSENISANATPVQFSVMSDEGIDLVVDLNSNPATWAKNFMAEMRITPPSEHGNFSSFISSLATKDDHSTGSPSGDIIVDIQNKGTENIVPSTDSSIASDVGENSRSVLYAVDTTTVNSVSSVSTVAGTPVELSRYQEGAPVVSSSCLTADVQNNVTSDIPGTLDNEVLRPEPADVFMQSERTTAPAVCASVQPISNRCPMSPGKTKVFARLLHSKSVAGTNNLSTFLSGDGVRSDSNEDSCPKSSGKQTGDVPARDQPAHSCGTRETLTENEPVKAVAVEENIGRDDTLPISCQRAIKTIAKLPVTDAQSPASSAGHFIAGNLDHTHPTSSATSDNAINSLTSKFGAESARSHDSTDKKGQNDAEELESETPPAYTEPPRNIQLSLRSASAKKVKPPRRSARLLPK